MLETAGAVSKRLLAAAMLCGFLGGSPNFTAVAAEAVPELQRAERQLER